jgi:hypothetical protein
MTSEVFKLQRSFNNDNMLAYNADMLVMKQWKATKSDLDLMGEDYKIYVIADYNKNTGKLKILRKTKTQTW